ncbi:MAG: hypothetical protein H7240_12380 [Glaciimonas sp.]|nr:hypothetical protein [Glaciimonas sp.]
MNIAKIGIEQHKAIANTVAYGYSRYICETEQTCGSAADYAIVDSVYLPLPWPEDVEFVLWAKDVNGIETYSTIGGSATGAGRLARYDATCTIIA